MLPRNCSSSISSNTPSKTPLSVSSTTHSTPSNKNLIIQRNTVVLDYIISHANGDQRPYSKVNVLGFPMLGLLDSGASNTLVGSPGLKILLSLGLKLNRDSSVSCTVANGETCLSSGIISTPFCLMGKIKVIDVIVVPELSHTLILGHDFWVSMDIIPDLKRDVWKFSSANTEVHCSGVQSKE